MTTKRKPIAPVSQHRRQWIFNRLPLLGELARWPGPLQAETQARLADEVTKRRFVPFFHTCGCPLSLHLSMKRKADQRWHPPLWQKLAQNRDRIGPRSRYAPAGGRGE